MTTEFPTPVDFFLKQALYVEHVVEGEDVWKAVKVIFFQGVYDSYCVGCEREATFRGKQDSPPEGLDQGRHERLTRVAIGHVPLPTLPGGTYVVSAECSRASHAQQFVFLVKVRFAKAENKIERVIQKIGQHPSFADLNLGKVKDYSDVLTNDQRGELSRAIGLASHDVGVGAYVYLRRVFEALVEEAHVVARNEDAGWDESAYLQAKMSDKISALKHHLPTFLTDHPKMYSLLSKGVHELSEAECLSHFDALKVGIELILDEKKELKKRKKKMQEAKAALSRAYQQASKSGVDDAEITEGTGK